MNYNIYFKGISDDINNFTFLNSMNPIISKSLKAVNSVFSLTFLFLFLMISKYALGFFISFNRQINLKINLVHPKYCLYVCSGIFF